MGLYYNPPPPHIGGAQPLTPKKLTPLSGPVPTNPPISGGATVPQAVLISWLPPPTQPLVARNLSSPIAGPALQAPPLWVRAPVELAAWAAAPWPPPQQRALARLIPAPPPQPQPPQQTYGWAAADWPRPLRRFLTPSGPSPTNPPISGGAAVPKAVLISWLSSLPPPSPTPWKVTTSGAPTIPDWPGGNVWWTTTSVNPGGRAWVSIGLGPNPTHQTRLRSLYLVLSGSAAGLATVVVRDGPSQMGRIIFAADLYTAANSADFLDLSEIDLRASVGRVLTVEFVAGIPGNVQEINAEGDFVAPGTFYGV